MVRSTGNTVTDRLVALAQLGRVMGAIGRREPWQGDALGLAEIEYDALDAAVRRAAQANGWATEENVRHAFVAWSQALDGDAPARWLAAYPELAHDGRPQRTVGLVLPGNVPLVGLHDLLCVWLSGHRAVAKNSTQEPELLPLLAGVLERFVPSTEEQVSFTAGRLGTVDAVIATGSDNTARYFEHYFGHLPRIVRKSRVSVAVLDGTETDAELAALGEDVFRYFGLGCRNVSKLYLPQDFDLDRLFGAFFAWKDIVHHKKYGNNYDYTRALWLLDRVPFLENGFLLLREVEALPSAVATLHYTRYTDREAVNTDLRSHVDKIQCIVGHGRIPFGQAQHPALWDYADDVDTMRFLMELR
ncbi:MAG: acyl-CoA reductase [Flavobacteriales bacterium]|nr:acyl-CoA reductase [Flavobacteriales bacterium]